MVVARISIQNCGWGTQRGRGSRQLGHSGQGRDRTGDRARPREKEDAQVPCRGLVPEKALASGRSLTLTKCLLCARGSPSFPLNLTFEVGAITIPF